MRGRPFEHMTRSQHHAPRARPLPATHSPHPRSAQPAPRATVLRYSGSQLDREKRCRDEREIDNTDPNSEGSIAHMQKKQKTALQGATATNEAVRSHFKDKGIGHV